MQRCNHLTSAGWIGLPTLLAALLPFSTAAVAQIAKSPPPPGAHTHEIVPGERYRAGAFKQWWLGRDYRELWVTPVPAQVLDLDSVGDGLTPMRTGGFGQSVTLHFQGRDGRRYIVRSVDKDPTKRLLPELKGTMVESVIQDQISALLPTGALVVDGLLEATGILHARHRLVVIPDDPRLGEFRAEFAGLLGMLVLHPDEGADDTPGFAGSRRIIGTDSFLDRLEDGPCDRVDAPTYLKARLMDMVIGDRDRHAGQWRWARFPDGDCSIWSPIPEDRDQAFVDYDGVVNWVLRRSRPQQIEFGPDYPDITGLTFNAWELDRELLVALGREAWDSLVSVVQYQLSDSVIEAAVSRLPPTHRSMIGTFLSGALRERRDRLDVAADEYFRLISRWVEMKATDRSEYVALEHRANGDLAIEIGLRDGDSQEPPYYSRTFTPDVTKEVRLYLRDGDDSVTVLGGPGRITLRIEGGSGDDVFVNRSGAASRRIRFYDSRGENRVEPAGGMVVDRRPYERPPARDQAHQHALDWGGHSLGYPIIGYAPDPGLLLAFRYDIERYGYRKDPYKAHHAWLGGFVTNGPRPMLTYSGALRHVLPRVDAQFRFRYTGLEFIRFNGFGNATELSAPASFYELEQWNVLVSPALTYHTGRNRGGTQGAGVEPLREEFAAHLSLQVKYWNTSLEENADRFIAAADPPPYGTGSFGAVGLGARVEADTRDNSGNPRRGVWITAGGTLYPQLWDVRSVFGEIHGAVAAYFTTPIPTQPTLALRVGGKKTWGDVPFLEAAYIGSTPTLRGYRSRRFAGEAAAHGSAELRFTVAPFQILVPGTLGLFALTDVGRVFHDGDPEDADEWHAGYGGGLWISVIDRLQTLSVAVAKGDDFTGLYVAAGFAY
jgi:hypothetical protein